ncbi:uncharacterized protein LOC144878465 [Branchiostoma floridae x Branchiostoma japonicum]
MQCGCEIYYRSRLDVIICKMAGLDAGPSPGAAINTLFTVEPKLLEDNPEVLLCCLDTCRVPLRFSGVSCLEIVTRRCHIAVPGDPPNVRRLCLMPDRNADTMFAGVPSPVKLRIKSSSTIKFNLSRDANKEEAQGTLLWEFEMLPTNRTALKLPLITADIPDLPDDVDLQPVDPSLLHPDLCNCQKSTQSPTVIVDMEPDMQSDHLSGALQDIQLSEEESDGSDENEDSGGDTDTEEQDGQTQSGQIFRVAGCTWQTYYQDALDACSTLRQEGKEVETRAVFETDNLHDKNAIKFEVFVNDSWQIVGHCPGPKIPKLTRAMKKGDVTDITLNRLRLEYCPPAQKNLYKAYVKIVKKGSWEKDSVNYKYNSVIST